MDLDKATSAHSEWKVKLRAAIARKEQLDAPTVGADNCCPLGMWLHADGKARYGKFDAYRETVKRHAAFHREAGAVARAINAGQYDAATKMLDAGTPYAAASSAVASAILGLKKVLAANSVQA